MLRMKLSYDMAQTDSQGEWKVWECKGRPSMIPKCISMKMFWNKILESNFVKRFLTIVAVWCPCIAKIGVMVKNYDHLQKKMQWCGGKFNSRSFTLSCEGPNV